MISSMEKFEDIVFDLLPDKKDFITQKEAVRIANEDGIPLSLRTFQLYVEKGILKKGFRQGKEVYYSKRYIIQELKAVHILKTTCHRSIEKIQRIAQYKDAYLYQIVAELHKALLFLFERDKNPKKSGRVFIEISNEKPYQVVIDCYFDRLLGAGVHKIEDIKHFVSNALKSVE